MRLIFGLLILLSTTVAVQSYVPFDEQFERSKNRWCDSCPSKKTFCTEAPCLRRGFNFVGQAIKDSLLLNINLISTESFIVIGATLPIYLASRIMDNSVQCHFFSHNGHRNINQMPHWCHEMVRFGIAIPIVLLGSQAFLSSDQEWREAGWMLLLGIPFVIFGKNIIKTFDADFCLRPWHDGFLKHGHKQSMGGFPSGHMAQATYIATLYGMRFGHQMAVPLAFFAAALGLVFINCNRHYISQVVAGAGLGALYGVAANKVIDSKLSENLSFNMCYDNGPAFRADYRF